MNTVSRILTILLLLLGSTARASITFQITPEHCTNADGTVYATVNGGVPPYTYSWSDGSTTPNRSNMGAGSYTLTVTDNLGAQQQNTAVVPNVPNWEWDPNSMFAQAIPSCALGGGTSDMGHVFFGGDIQQAPGGPAPHQFDHACSEQPFSVGTVPSDWQWFVQWGIVTAQCFWGTSGQTYAVNYTDANGCPGYMEAVVPQPPQFYPVAVLDIEGSCSGGANGSIRFSIPAEPEYIYGAKPHLFNPDGQLNSNFESYLATNWTNGWTYDVPNLGPGTYALVRRLTIDPLFAAQFPCGDTTYITVPDLGPTCGHVTGTVAIDVDANCLFGGSDVRIPEMILEFLPGPYYATTNQQGNYGINLPLGSYTVTQQTMVVDEHCLGDPIPLDVLGNTTLNLLDTALLAKDVQLSMASGPARPGFELRYAIDLDNLTSATSPINSLVLTFDANVSYISATPNPSSVTGNTITWNSLGSLYYYYHRDIDVRFQVPPDVGLIGSELQATATVTSTGDVNTTNNTAAVITTVTGSYDPNDKTAATSSGWSSDLYYIDVDEWVDYTIRFQNTGTDTAFTVVVTDTLPATLDASSITVGAGSHPFTWNLHGSGVLKMYFVNILLPDSGSNEALSHGFAGFRIKPQEPLAPGTVIENIANIYFDYNPPVTTEPSVVVAEFSTAVADIVPTALSITPNPASDLLTMRSLVGRAPASITLMTVDGRVIRVPMRRMDSTIELDIRSLAPGTYLIRTSEGQARFVKQ